MSDGPIRVGTRGTRLAILQAEEVLAALREKFPALTFEVKQIANPGDDEMEKPISDIGSTGVFVTGLEEALLSREIDIAVHSAKDVPSTVTAGLVVGAFTRRLDGRDALVTRDPVSALEDLPQGAKIGTSSPRRKAYVAEKRPDIEVLPIRGSIETRLAKLDAGEFDALLLAVAGLKRLRLEDRITCPLDEEWYIPAAGQGSLAIEVRQGEYVDLCAALNDATTKDEVEAERSFLKAVGAGCQAPVGVRGWLREREVFLKGFVGMPDASQMYRSGRLGPRTMGKVSGQLLGSMMLAMGGRDVLVEWRGTLSASSTT